MRSKSHELGHYLGLLHVWGPDWVASGTSCEIKCHDLEDCATLGDRICDTEPCIGLFSTPDCSPFFGQCASFNCPDGYEDLPYPKENYMSYTHSCQDRFTEGQAIRMQAALGDFRATLWSDENLICTGAYLLGDGGGVYVQSDQVWTASSLPLSNNGDISVDHIVIESGATLTVESDVVIRFCETGKIIIKPNAELRLSGTLTSNCSSWQGIEVWGDGSQSQYRVGGTRAQGKFTGNSGSVIENAETAIKLYGPTYNDAGGQIVCSGTTFLNNSTAIEFAPYQNYWPFATSQQGQPRSYFGRLTDCTFLTDNNYAVNTPQESALLEIRDLTGRLVAEQKVMAFAKQSVDLRAQQAGIYYYQLYVADDLPPLVGKLIIQ